MFKKEAPIESKELKKIKLMERKATMKKNPNLSQPYSSFKSIHMTSHSNKNSHHQHDTAKPEHSH